MLARHCTKLVGRAAAFSTAKVGAVQATSGTEDLKHAILQSGKRRAYIVTDPATGAPSVSDPSLEPLVQFLASAPDFLRHEAMFFEVGATSDTLMGAFIWNTNRGQACGGIRMRPYATMGEFLTDGMRLAIGMGMKSALAGLWWGGGKGVVAQVPGVQSTEPRYRTALFNDYGNFLTSLRGCYVGAEDSGVSMDDIDVVFSKTRYTTCISPHKGGSGNPSVPTAAGVVSAIEAALDHLNLGTIRGKTVVVQGAGSVGLPLVQYLLEKEAGRIIVGDISEQRVEQALLFEDCDVLAPCAWGGVLNQRTIPRIRAKVVCGAANNQVHMVGDQHRLRDAGITYVPDFVANRMGIVNCANEQYGRVGPLASTSDPAISRHFSRDWPQSVYNTVKLVLQTAESKGISTNEAATAMALAMAEERHPIWPSRSRQIIEALVSERWHEGFSA